MKFKANGVTYLQDMFGVVHQLDRQPFTYDASYSATYDTPEYKRNSDILQALRLSYVIGAHGEPVSSLIDVGYGNGAFMKFAKQAIKIVGGMDVTGVPVPDGCYFTDKFEPVDVVTFFDCLEHIPDLMFVRDIPAKTIVISLPYCHISDRGFEWFENDYYHLKVNEHLHHFDDQSLAAFMDNMGWHKVGVADFEDIVRKRDPEWNILTGAFKRKPEVWLPVPGWEDKYEVSNFGRVKSLSRRIGGGKGYYSKERILNQMNDAAGYRQVSFPVANRKNVTMKVHKLIASTFISNPENKPCINHKNGVRWHNYVTNLEWVTISENVKHGFDYNGRRIENFTTRIPIRQLSLQRQVVRIWESGLQMQKEGGYERSAINKAIRTGRPYYGFYWEYAFDKPSDQ